MKKLVKSFMIYSSILISIIWNSELSRLMNDSSENKVKIDIIRGRRDFQASLARHPQYYIIVLFDPKKCLKCFVFASKILKSLSELEFIRDYDCGLGLVNTNDFREKPRKNTKIGSGLVLVHKGQGLRIDEYKEISQTAMPYKRTHERLLKITLDYIFKQLIPFRQITSIEDAKSELSKHKRIGIYLGDHIEENFQIFKRLALKNGNIPLFYTYDSDLVEKIMNNFYFYPNQISGNSFFEISLINPGESNNSQVALLSPVKSEEELKRFLILNKYSKIITDISWNQIVYEFLINKINIIMLVTSSNNPHSIEKLGDNFAHQTRDVNKIIAFLHITKPNKIFENSFFDQVKENDLVLLYPVGTGVNTSMGIMLSNEELTEFNLQKFFDHYILVNDYLTDRNMKDPTETANLEEKTDDFSDEDEAAEVGEGEEEKITLDEPVSMGCDKLRWLPLIESSWVARLSAAILVIKLIFIF
jgi:hypothetical protein